MNRRYLWSGLLLVGLGLFGLVAFQIFQAERKARAELVVVENEANRVYDEMLKPLGAVDTGRRYVQGEGSIGRLSCMYTVCPGLKRSWFVPLELGKEIGLLRETFGRLGYEFRDDDYAGKCVMDKEHSYCGMSGKRDDGLRLGLALGPVHQEQQPPPLNVAPRQWVELTVSIEDLDPN